MRIFTLLGIFVLLMQGGGVFAQNPESSFNEKDCYNFYINRVDEFDKRDLLKVSAPYTNLISLTDTADIWENTINITKDLLAQGVSIEDIHFINQQITASVGFVWKSKKLAGMQVFDSKEKFPRKYRYHTLGVPLFSLDKTKCLVKEGIYGHVVYRKRANFTGNIKLSIYRLENNRWVRTKVIAETVMCT